MKLAKSVSFDLKTIDLIDEYMVENKLTNFSRAVNFLIRERYQFKKISDHFQTQNEEK